MRSVASPHNPNLYCANLQLTQIHRASIHRLKIPIHTCPPPTPLPFPERLRLLEQDDPEVRSQVSQIHERLDVMETSMLAYKRQFSAYEYLWTTDLQGMFAGFLEEASYDEAMEEDDDDPAGIFCCWGFGRFQPGLGSVLGPRDWCLLFCTMTLFSTTVVCNINQMVQDNGPHFSGPT